VGTKNSAKKLPSGSFFHFQPWIWRRIIAEIIYSIFPLTNITVADMMLAVVTLQA